MKGDIKRNQEYAKQIAAYERRITALKKEQIAYLQGKYLSIENKMFFWAKKILNTKAGIILDGVSFKLDETSFVIDIDDCDNFTLDDLSIVTEITPEAFYDHMNKGLRFVKDNFFQKQFSQQLIVENKLLNKYLLLENNDFFYVQKIIRSDEYETTIAGLNLTVYDKCIFFCKEDINVRVIPEDVKEMTEEEFQKQVQQAIKVVEDSIPVKYR